MSSVHAAGVPLVNAAELVEFEPIATQVHVCESCGITQCQPGGWVAMRRVGDLVVWVPAWAEMEAAAEWQPNEFLSPAFLASRGAPVFDAAMWARMRGLVPALPDASDLLPLDSRDAVRAIQWSAPGRVLGEFPAAPRLRRDALLAVTEGDLAHSVQFVNTAAGDWFNRPQALQSPVADAAAGPIEFHLDIPGLPAWTPFARTHSGPGVVIEGAPWLLHTIQPLPS